MSKFVSITVGNEQFQVALSRLASSVLDMTPAMRKIAGTLEHVVEENFEAEGRPRWQPLSTSTVDARLGGKKAYTKTGKLRASAQRQLSSFRILQHTGQLAASVSSAYDSTEAAIGSNKVYAAIHQFGGAAGRGGKVDILARPYLPVTVDGSLQPEAHEAVLGTILRHIKTAAGA
ncbi:phage virion morphogenesis protein [Ralstonia solanacearum]|uniref:phage virion morphogenesis protein n=1 Tax=Ralstonia solanacearum TaxID=305 RepID=UPI0001D94B78|nr:phage virion morphogenesis protein [Ralstonia solanacearum]CBJ43005.1 putative phage virion morphogenesis protein [Ralstonia solanacearum CFBP2957]